MVNYNVYLVLCLILLGIRNYLLENEQECPSCGAENVSPDSLVINKQLRQVNYFFPRSCFSCSLLIIITLIIIIIIIMKYYIVLINCQAPSKCWFQINARSTRLSLK